MKRSEDHCHARFPPFWHVLVESPSTRTPHNSSMTLLVALCVFATVPLARTFTMHRLMTIRNTVRRRCISSSHHHIQHQIDEDSELALKNLIGDRIPCLRATVHDQRGNRTEILAPASFGTVGSQRVVLTTTWHTSPEWYDYHTLCFRHMDESSPPLDTDHTPIDLGSSCPVHSIDILRQRSQVAVKQNDKWVPCQEIVTYDCGINLHFTDGAVASIVVEEISILGSLHVSPVATEPSCEKTTEPSSDRVIPGVVNQLDIRKTLTG